MEQSGETVAARTWGLEELRGLAVGMREGEERRGWSLGILDATRG